MPSECTSFIIDKSVFFEILDSYRPQSLDSTLTQQDIYDGQELYSYFLYSLGANACCTLQEAIVYGLIEARHFFRSEEVSLEQKIVLFKLIEQFLIDLEDHST